MYILRFVVVLALSSVGVWAQSADYYVSLKAGSSWIKFENASYNSTLAGNQNHEYDSSAKDTVGSGGLSLGYYFRENIRVEMEYIYRDEHKHVKAPTNSGIANAYQETGIQTLMVQSYYDFEKVKEFTPFVFGGVGIAQHEFDFRAEPIPPQTNTYAGTKTTTSFAANVGFGASYPINEQLALELSYRFSWFGEGRWQGMRDDGADKGYGGADFWANEVLLGLQYKF